METAGGNPTKFITAFKEAGIKVLHKCTAVRFALKKEQLGASAISLTGFEAAGHPGEDNVPNAALLSNVLTVKTCLGNPWPSDECWKLVLRLNFLADLVHRPYRSS